jgi:hypothetical protein
MRWRQTSARIIERSPSSRRRPRPLEAPRGRGSGGVVYELPLARRAELAVCVAPPAYAKPKTRSTKAEAFCEPRWEFVTRAGRTTSILRGARHQPRVTLLANRDRVVLAMSSLGDPTRARDGSRSPLLARASPPSDEGRAPVKPRSRSMLPPVPHTPLVLADAMAPVSSGLMLAAAVLLTSACGSSAGATGAPASAQRPTRGHGR